MARTKIGGVENVRKRKIAVSVEEQSEAEARKKRKVFKKNHVYYVSEWVPDTDTVLGEPDEGNTTIAVQLKENIRLETPTECEERKAAYAAMKLWRTRKKARLLVLDCSSHGGTSHTGYRTEQSGYVCGEFQLSVGKSTI